MYRLVLHGNDDVFYSEPKELTSDEAGKWIERTLNHHGIGVYLYALETLETEGWVIV